MYIYIYIMDCKNSLTNDERLYGAFQRGFLIACAGCIDQLVKKVFRVLRRLHKGGMGLFRFGA